MKYIILAFSIAFLFACSTEEFVPTVYYWEHTITASDSTWKGGYYEIKVYNEKIKVDNWNEVYMKNPDGTLALMPVVWDPINLVFCHVINYGNGYFKYNAPISSIGWTLVIFYAEAEPKNFNALDYW